MSSPGSLEKNSSPLSENLSPGRSKFAVGINPLEESQQNIRIQLAVHRYNSSTGNSYIRPLNERTIPSPFKHAFLKSSPKYKSFENDKEESPNTLKKTNLYQGVGNFPVVHLKKNINPKPVKKAASSEFKIQLPELPLNRFLNHSPDVGLDTKTSTRSLLDVLQDLSRKRIHTKDDNDVTKRKSKGLGGDAPLDLEAPYKPLFVTKNKSNTVTLRDSTTQTLETPSLDTSLTKKCETVVNNEKDDPKAELRRKLARQNNEIFASLSSSTLSYPLKRNADKISSEGGRSDRAKRAKYFSEDTSDKLIQNGTYTKKDILSHNTVADQSGKIEKRQKVVEGNKISPNKDRLTTIFLEMQNTNPKMEVLKNNDVDQKEEQSSVKTPADKQTEEKLTASESKGSRKENGSDTLPNNDTLKSSSVSITSAVDSPKASDDKLKNVTESSTVSPAKENLTLVSSESSVVDKTNVTGSAVTFPNFQMPANNGNLNFGVPTSSPGFKLPLASTVSSSLTQTPIFSTGISQNGYSFGSKLNVVNGSSGARNELKNEAKKENGGDVGATEVKVPAPTPSQTRGLSETTPQLFKFGVNASQTEPATSEPKTNPVTTGENNVATNLPKSPVFSASLSTGINPVGGFTTSSPSAGLSTTGNTSLFTTTSVAAVTTTTMTTTFSLSQANNSLFTFSGTTSTAGDKPSFSTTFGTVSSGTTVQAPMFGLGSSSGTSKPEEKPQEKQINEQSKEPTKATPTTASFPTSGTFSASGFPIGASSFGQSATTTQANIAPFKFGEKVETTVKTSESALPTSGSIFEQKPSAGIFTFGQKSGSVVTNTFGQKTGEPVSNAFGQKNADPVNGGSAPNTFGQKSDSSVTSIFGQKSSEPASNTFMQKSNEPTTTASSQPAVSQSNTFQSNLFCFGQKPTVSTSTAQTTQSSSIFGQATSTQSSLFQPSAASQPSTSTNTGLGSTPSPFGATSRESDLDQNKTIPSFLQTTSSSAPTSINTFSQNKLSMPMFGQSTSGFAQASTNFSSGTSVFSSNSSQAQPTFGSSTTTQASPFNQSYGNNEAKPSTSLFMQPNSNNNNSNNNNNNSNDKNKTPTFGQSTAFGSTVFGQSTRNEGNIFGQNQNQNQNVQGTPFGSNQNQTFGSQSPFTFGTPSTSSTSTNFTLNPTTTTASLFTFGSTTKTTPASTSNFVFNSGSQPSTSSQPSPFTFNSQSNSPFTFGGAGKDTPAFGGSSAPKNFGFPSSPATSDASKPAAASVFSFGASQPASSSGFNFTATPSPVFSFGGSSTSDSGSKFQFGASPSTSGMFIPGLTPSPITGVFSMGTGSNKSRKKTVTRTRRRT